MSTRVPLDPEGYSVNRDTGTIHTRYADHGNGVRTRTEKGVRTLLDGKAGKLCKDCYPSPMYASSKSTTPQVRRSASNA